MSERALYVLGINGSPRIGGNTDILLDKAMEGAKGAGANVEKMVLSNLNFSPCLECENLPDDGSCIVDDDMQTIYKKLEAADVIIVASPIFFGSLSAQTKMMIDRFQCAWRAKYILKKEKFGKKKVGVFLSVQGTEKKDFFNNSKAIIKNLFSTVNAVYKEELFCSGVEAKGNILRHSDCLKRAYRLGQEIVKPLA